jgi:hypothetical protein
MATRTKKVPEAEIAITEVGPTDAVEENLVDTDYGAGGEPGDCQEPGEGDGLEELLDAEVDAQVTDAEAAPEAPEAPEEAPELPVRLVGQELLDFYNAKKAEGWSHETIGFNAGYVSITKTKQERFQAAAFNKEYLKAQGTIQEGESSPGGGRSHAGETRARVTGQGVLLVSQLAVNRVGAVAGEVFAVEYPADGQILLTSTGVVEAVIPRGKRVASAEQAGTPLLDQAAEA